MARIQQLTLAGGSRGMLLLALAAGLIAAVIVFVVLNNDNGSDSNSTASGATSGVLTAAQDIPAGTDITADMLEVVSVPDSLLVSGAYADSQLVIGEASRVSIAKGEQITPAKLGSPVPDKGLSGVVPNGKRAVGLEVSEVTAVGGLLLPGDHVDIVAATIIDNAPGLAEDESLLRTETILQNVEVLSVAQQAQKPSAGPSSDPNTQGSPAYTSGQIPDNVEEEPNAGTLTLALDPSQAEVLISYQQNAEKVWVVLRPYGDQSIVELPANDLIITGNQ